MPTTKATDPYKRNKTRHPGVTYRLKADGTRTYAVYSGGRFITVQGGEKEALALQGDLRRKRHRGEHVPAPSKLTFAEVAEQWFASKHKLRAWTRKNYREAQAEGALNIAAALASQGVLQTGGTSEVKPRDGGGYNLWGRASVHGRSVTLAAVYKDGQVRCWQERPYGGPSVPACG